VPKVEAVIQIVEVAGGLGKTDAVKLQELGGLDELPPV